VLGNALAAGAGTKGIKFDLIDQGVNGGTVTDLVRGFSPWGHLDPSKPQSNITFAETIARDKPDIVAIQVSVVGPLLVPLGVGGLLLMLWDYSRCCGTSGSTSWMCATTSIHHAFGPLSAGARRPLLVVRCSVPVPFSVSPLSGPTPVVLLQ
jgi:hypothetical protein